MANLRSPRVRSFAPIVIVLLLVACAGATPQRVALNSLQGIRQSVVTAVQVFNAGYQAGQFSDAQRTSLGVLYGKYVSADNLAATALGATTVGTDPTVLVGQITALAADVINFVNSLKPPATPNPSPAPVKAPAPASPATTASVASTLSGK